MDAGIPEGVTIGTFRGDYEALERMARASWRDEYGEASFPNFYRPAFLHFLFDRFTGTKGDHLLAAYRGEEIAAFLANVPQTFRLRGRLYRAVYSCLLVTRREDLRKGLALTLIRAAIEGNKTYGYDFSLLTLETGHRSTKLIAKLRAEGHRIESVRRSGVLARILDLDRVAASESLKGYERAAIRLYGAHRPPKDAPEVELRDFRASDLDACLGLLARYQETLDLALVWDRAELALELDHPGVSRTFVWERDGLVRAMINFIGHDHIGRTVERWAWINHVAFGDLAPAERSAFVRAYLARIKAEGYVGTIDFSKRGWPAGPFYRARFIPYPRSVNLISWTFNPEISLAGIPVVYEIQV